MATYFKETLEATEFEKCTDADFIEEFGLESDLNWQILQHDPLLIILRRYSRLKSER